MTRVLTRTFSAAAAAAMVGALLFAGAGPASADHDKIGHDGGSVAEITNGRTLDGKTDGADIDWLQVSAPAACDAAATRHVLKLVRVTATDPAQQPQADAWVGDNLYSPIGVGLPGPLTVQMSNSWKGWADTYGQTIVPGNYEFELRCQNNLGTVLYEKWSGGVTFDTPTHWTANDLNWVSATAVTASPETATAGDDVTVTAQVSEPTDNRVNDPTGTVEFFNGATSVGAAPVDASGTATVVVSGLAAGTYTFTGTYSGDFAFASSSGTSNTVTVTAPNTAPVAVDDAYATGQDT
ncbi:MAG: Ig-like domain-containing protein, partial [Actinomycetes bacterium]